jgi:integrase
VRRTGIAAIGDGDPVLYYPPVGTFDANGNFLSRQVHPLSRKRIEVLFVRVREHLEWADQRGLRCHDIRHTSGRLIYKAADQQMARLHLAHDAGNSTDHYLSENMDELRKLKETLFEPPADQAAADE